MPGDISFKEPQIIWLRLYGQYPARRSDALGGQEREVADVSTHVDGRHSWLERILKKRGFLRLIPLARVEMTANPVVDYMHQEWPTTRCCSCSMSRA